MKLCKNVTPDGPCPNPKARGRKLCAVCLDLGLADTIFEEENITVEVKPVSRRPILGGNPKAAQAAQRTCAGFKDDGSRPCEKQARSNSAYCNKHETARRDPELDENLTGLTCVALERDGRCGDPSFAGSAYCKKHYRQHAIDEGATPATVKTQELDDIEGQLKGIHEDIANLRSILRHGTNDKDRINAARSLQRMQWQADTMHKQWIKAKRAESGVMPFKIAGLGSTPENRLARYLDLEELEKELPEGETL